MQPYAVAVPTVSGEPNKWWYLVPGIIFTIVTIFSALGLLVTGFVQATGILSEIPEPEAPGPYPENGTSDEQAHWNRSNSDYEIEKEYMDMLDEMENSGLMTFQLVSGGFGILISVGCIILLFSRHEKAFHACGGWIAYNVVVSVIITIWSNRITAKFYETTSPDFDVATFSLIGNIATIVGCNVVFIALAVLGYMNTRVGESQIPESGFHTQEKVDVVVVSHDTAPVSTAFLSGVTQTQPQMVAQPPSDAQADVIIGNIPGEH